MSAAQRVDEFRELPPTVWKLLEERVDAFEAAWVDGDRPSLADYLLRPDSTEGQLLIELICADFEFRLQAGEAVRVDEYLDRYPELGDRVETVSRLRRLEDEAGPRETVLESLVRGLSETTPSRRVAGEVLDFEKEWRSGNRPRIEDYLGRSGEPERSTLFLDLLTTEISFRHERNEIPEPGEYARRFPDFELQLQEVDWGGREGSETSPQRFAGFDLLEQRGAGGFGVVWKARDRRLDRIVALKIPHPHRLDARSRSSLVREARAAARLRHPNIVGIHQVEISGQTPYIVLDYVEGTNLKQWLATRPPTAKQAAELCATLARAVQHAHEQGVIHRDLKPANVLVDQTGVLHVSDFGLAKRRSSDELETRDGLVMGSLPYMSPEQASGQSRTADARTDVYALGTILYEMLVGQPPFKGDELTIMRLIVEEDPVEPRRIRSDVPCDLEAICLKAMAKDPSRRYSTATELAQDLDRFLHGETVRAKTWNRGLRPALRVLRRRKTAALVALIIIPFFTALATWRAYAMTAGLPSSPVSPSPTDAPAINDEYPLPEKLSRPTGDSSAIDSPLAPRIVEIRTDPPGAEIWLFPRDPLTGWIRPQDRIDGANVTPARFELAPGDYCIVADLGGGRFLELDHRIPLPDEISIAEQSLDWKRNDSDGSIWFEFDIPPAPNLADFLFVPEGDFVVAKGTPDEKRVKVPAFYVAPRLMTAADYLSYLKSHYERNGRSTEQPRLSSYAVEFAADPEEILPLKYARAEAIVSKASCRMFDEIEWERAASLGVIAVEGEEARAEWTSSWFGSYPWTLSEDVYRSLPTIERVTSDHKFPFIGRSHAVRGLSPRFLGDPRMLNADEIGIESRRPGRFFKFYPEIGVRLARSVKPRRDPEDFIQILP